MRLFFDLGSVFSVFSFFFLVCVVFSMCFCVPFFLILWTAFFVACNGLKILDFGFSIFLNAIEVSGVRKYFHEIAIGTGISIVFNFLNDCVVVA